ncbi:sensor histidine kinase [Rhodocaloribacter sp.]
MPYTSVRREEKALDQERHQADSTLGRSIEQFRALIENALDIIMVLDAAGEVDYASPSVTHILGHTLDDLTGRRIFDYVHAEDEAAFARAFRRVVEAGEEEVRMTIRFRHRSGAWRTLETTWRGLTGEDGVRRGVLNARDITERRWAEEALRESEQQYRALIEQSADAIYVLQDDAFVLVNRAWEELFGYTRAEVLSPRFEILSVVAPRSRGVIEERRRRRAAGKPVAPVFEVQGRRRDGQTLDLEVSEADILWKGRPAIQGIYRDVTERKRAEKELRRYAERLEVLRAIDQALLSAQSSSTIAEAAVEHIRKLIPCLWAGVLLTDPEMPGTLTVAAQAGEPLLLPAEARFSVAEFDLTDVLRQGAPVADGVSPEPVSSLGGLIAGAGVQTIMRAALHMQEELLGVVVLGAGATQAFTEDHRNIAREVAEQLSVAMHSMRLFEAVSAAHARLEQLSHRLVEVQEQERRHIALELHDEIGQVLTALNYTLDFSGVPLTPGQEEKLARAHELVRLLTSRVRDLSLNLRPSMLDDLGLMPALLWYCERYQTQTGIKVHLHPLGVHGRRFRPEVETAAYRIIQEALNNVARYAEVDEVWVRVWIEPAELYVEVVDHGKGFDPKQVKRGRPSAGLSGMQERAALVGGALHIEAGVGKGVYIRAVLPREPKEQAG